MTVSITRLPPGPVRPELEYGQHLTDGLYPVSAEFGADGEISSTGIAFEDYSRMATSTKAKLDHGRKLERPLWAINPEQLRKLVIRYMEARAIIHKPTGTDKERIDCAQNKLDSMRARRVATLTKICKRYVELKKQGTDIAKIKKLGEEIENLDSTIKFERNIAGRVLRIVHCYYSLGYNSVDVAHEVGIKPPAVRQILWKLHREWELLQKRPSPTWRGPRIRINLIKNWKPSRKRVDLQLAQIMLKHQSFTATAAALKVNNKTLIKRMRAAGLKPKANRRYKKPQFDRTEMARLRAVGLSYRNIAKQLGCNSRTVHKALGLHYKKGMRRAVAFTTIEFKQKMQADIDARPVRTCKGGHDLSNPEHVHVGDLMRTGRRTCNTCWAAQHSRWRNSGQEN